MISSGIETTEGGRIILRDKTWEYQDCKFTFRELRSDRRRCPEMLGPTCDMYDGAICCAQKCPGNARHSYFHDTILLYTLDVSICFDQTFLAKAQFWKNDKCKKKNQEINKIKIAFACRPFLIRLGSSHK